MTPLHEDFGIDLEFHNQSVESLAAEILSAMERRRVVRVRGLTLDETSQLDLAASLGTIVGQRAGRWRTPVPNIRYERGGDRYAHRWHSDQSWAASDAWTMLSCVEVDAEPEATLFIDTCAALSSLSDELLQRVGDRTILHDVRNSRRVRPAADAADRREPLLDRLIRRLMRLTAKFPNLRAPERPLLIPAQSHRDGTSYPIVDCDVASGARHLRVGDHGWSISGLDRPESERLLRDIHEALETPENVFRQSWMLDDLVICDNRTVLHRRESASSTAPGRVLRRVLVVPNG